MRDAPDETRSLPDRRRADRRRAVQHAPGAMWTAEEVAAYLNVSASWVRHRVAADRLPHHRVGGWIVRFDPAEIRAWATSRKR
jgi:excisionase family DNA binding protein